MQMLDLKHITLTGELAFRLGRNFSRLEDPMYRAPEIFQADQQGWPGDWEGRTMLALCLHEQLSGRKAAFLDDVLEALEARWNEKGYLGEIYPYGVINEQQLAGHNWLLRSFMELYCERQDERDAKRAARIVENLYLPLLGHFLSYPSDPEKRVLKGDAAGHIAGNTLDGWMLSTDIGCAFISLDALTQYYSLFGGEQIRALICEMIESFKNIDVENCSLQTHATLSTLRGVLRFCETEPNAKLQTFAEELFDHYIRHGMTANYANYNWFGRPYWTEPCAVVDSYMAAMALFRMTKCRKYAVIANRIYYNALLAAQRPNGGFGCDQCSGTAQSGELLQPKADVYEAWWCCSMRGAEGLCSAAANCILFEAEQIWFVNYLPGKFSENGLEISVKTHYPDANDVRISIRGVASRKTLRFYVPDSAEDAACCINGQVYRTEEASFLTIPMESDGTLLLSFQLTSRQEPAIGCTTVKGAQVTMLGDQVLGTCENDRSILLAERFYHIDRTKSSGIKMLNLSAARRR